MAWRSSSTTNSGLVRNLEKFGELRSPKVIEAFLSLDRGNYAPMHHYMDSPQDIGFGATISAPHMHAMALEVLQDAALREHAKILDVGCGSGYVSSLFARLNPTAKVFGIDYVPELVKLSEDNTKKSDNELLTSGRVKFICGNGWDGLASEAPFDVIHVGAAASSLPMALANQLKINGKMLIPIGFPNSFQQLYLYEKIKESGSVNEMFSHRSLSGVAFVPLVKNDTSK